MRDGHNGGDERRRAGLAVRLRLRAAAGSLDEAGLAGSFLPGLWAAVIQGVIGTVHPDYLVPLLEEAASDIQGFGSNADAPALKVDAAAAKRDETALREAAAVLIAQALEGALDDCESQEIGEEFPGALLDVLRTVSAPTWGPAHLRRLLLDQIALLKSGDVAVLVPRGPARLNDAGR